MTSNETTRDKLVSVESMSESLGAKGLIEIYMRKEYHTWIFYFVSTQNELEEEQLTMKVDGKHRETMMDKRSMHLHLT